MCTYILYDCATLSSTLSVSAGRPWRQARAVHAHAAGLPQRFVVRAWSALGICLCLRRLFLSGPGRYLHLRGSTSGHGGAAHAECLAAPQDGHTPICLLVAAELLLRLLLQARARVRKRHAHLPTDYLWGHTLCVMPPCLAPAAAAAAAAGSDPQAWVLAD